MPSAAEAAKASCLIITSATGLRRSLDESGVKRVIDRLGALAEGMRTRGIDAIPYVPDAQGGPSVLPALGGDITPEALSGALRTIEANSRAGKPFDYVLIVGGGGVIPYWTVANPASDSDGEFPSDVPYAVSEPGAGGDALLVPDRAVGRIPLGAGKLGGADLVSYLERLVSGGGTAVVAGRFGLSAAEWEEQSAKVFSTISSREVEKSPPVDIDSFKAGWLSADSVLYFNVHGSKEDHYWYGQKALSYPKVLGPEIVVRSRPERSVVVAEACYGALFERSEPENSISYQLLSKGVVALVGSSAIAYGSADRRLTEADLLASLFLKRLLDGVACGVGFREAKIDFAAEMLRRQGYLDGDDKKTLLAFNLYGDPTMSLRLTESVEEGTGKMISDELMALIKGLVAERFPEMVGVEPVLAVEPAELDGSVAKKLSKMRPGPAEKGVSPGPTRLFVASFRRTVAVGTRDVERIVRVTFDERGGVRKIVTSK